jgi:hypothetical protein
MAGFGSFPLQKSVITSMAGFESSVAEPESVVTSMAGLESGVAETESVITSMAGFAGPR